MALEAIGGVVLDKVIGELIKPLVDGGKKAAAFSDILERVETVIKIIGPTLGQIKKLSGELDRPKEENEELIQLFDKGEKLVQKCSKVRWWTPNRWKYANKLTAFYESLLLFFKFYIPLQQYSTNMEILGHLQSQFRSGNGRVSGRSRSSFGSVSSRSSGEIGCLYPCYAPDPPDFMVGLDLPLKEVKKRLCKDDISKIVVSAPGGCGKTTLVRKLCQDPDVKEKFQDNIFYVTVSKVHNLKLIVGNLFEHNGFRVPEFPTDEDAINQLEQLLKSQGRKGPILLVLDDVWKEPEFPLQKFAFKIPEYRILVTSRYEFPSFGPTYKLNLLNDEDAMRLFLYSAFQTDGNVDEDFDDLVNEIVKRCGGFPLALQVVGGSLYEQPVQVWESRLMELSKGQSIFDSEKRLLDCLQLSLASLDGELKECFMDLGLFPEDQKIPVTALIDMWAELYKLDKNGVQAISNLHKLSAQNLLNLIVTRKDASEADGCYDDAFVMQHDLLRDLAMHQSSQKPMEERKRLILDLSENKLPQWWTEDKQPCIKARLLSIFTDRMFSSSWCNMQVPEVEALILNFQTTENYTLLEFMKQMDKLKVLVVTNYGSSAAELINFSVLSSLSNLKRIRLEHVSIPALCDTMVELKNLQKISLIMCKINRALNSSPIQIPSMFPNLMEINIDYCNDLVRIPDGLCDLVQLNKLSISNCHKLSALPEGIGRLENLEVLRLHTCTKLLGLPDSIGSLHKLTVLDITGCFRVKKLPKHMGELCRLRKLYLRKCRGLRELPPSIMDLKQLKKVVCDTETAQLWEEHRFANLKISIPEETIDLNWLDS